MKLTIDAQIGLVLNPIQLADQPVLYQLMDEVYRAGYRYIWEDQGDWYVNLIYNPETVRKELSRPKSHYFFVELQGKKVGILKYDFPFSPREIEIPNAMKLHRIYLHPEAQGTGIAGILLAHCLEIARKASLDSIWLEAMECQDQARRFYEKNGFREVLTYTLEFERIFPQYRRIQILKLNL